MQLTYILENWNSSKLHFLKYKKSVLLRKYKEVLNMRARKFNFLKYKKHFLSLALKV